MIKQFHEMPVFFRVLCLLVIITFSATVIAPALVVAQENQHSGLDVCAKAKADRKADGGGGVYFFAGFFCGLVGFVISAVTGGNPPAERLIGMDPSEANLYVSCYKSEKRKTQMEYAGLGWASSVVILLAIIASSSND